MLLLPRSRIWRPFIDTRSLDSHHVRSVQFCILSFSASLVLVLSILPGRSASYYISSSGQDTNSGVAPAVAWKTISRANGQALNPGDQLLFQAGATFSGTIFIGAPEGGTLVNPIVVSSFGAGRATINGGNTNGFYAYNCGGLVVSNLNFVGSGRATNHNSGIEFYNDGGGIAAVLDFLRVDQVDVSGFGFVGITIESYMGTNAYHDIRVTHADVHDNANAGIQTYAQYSNLHSNVYIGWCCAWNNPGTAGASGNTGSGIVLGEVNNAVIERCVAWTNGWLGDASIGIWCYDSTHVTIQFCESHHNRTAGLNDGGGFDFDGGTTSSVMQYNYSHDNSGAGYGLYQYLGAAPYSNNIIRFNISENDGRKNSYAGIQLWNGSSGIHDMEIYNNTIFVSPAPSGVARAVYFQTTVSNIHFRNNLLVTTGGVSLVDAVNTQPGVLFQGNDYWSSGGTFAIKWGSKTHATLDGWRTASGMETLSGNNTGFSVDPQLMNAGGGGTLGDAALLDSLTAYQLKLWSPMREAGLNLIGLFGVNPGTSDFFGNAVPNGFAFDIGAHDAALYLALTNPAFESGHFTSSYLRGTPARPDLTYAAELYDGFSAICTNCVVPVLTNDLGDGSELVKLREVSPASGARFLRVKASRSP